MSPVTRADMIQPLGSPLAGFLNARRARTRTPTLPGLIGAQRVTGSQLHPSKRRANAFRALSPTTYWDHPSAPFVCVQSTNSPRGSPGTKVGGGAGPKVAGTRPGAGEGSGV